MTWKLEDAPAQTGRLAIVTGANTGLGFETALGLAQKEASIVMACRDLAKAEEAAGRIRDQVQGADIKVMQLDLASLASVKAFADGFLASHDRLDLLINNAGLMMSPRFETEDGFEGQIGVNFLGHFALTGYLLDLLVKTEGSRVVHLASQAHRMGRINLKDLQSEKRYQRQLAYGQSKLACLIFAFEMNRRLQAAGHKALSVAAHPGASSTDLPRHLPGFAKVVAPYVSQPAWDGAQPTLYAALGNDIDGGDYCGPNGIFELAGKPVKVGSRRAARNEALAKDLWAAAQNLTGVRYL